MLENTKGKFSGNCTLEKSLLIYKQLKSIFVRHFEINNFLLKRIEVKKGEILQRKSDLNSKVYYVESGLLRSYAISHKGKEHIYMFAPEGWIIADNAEPGEPCDLFIDAIEDSIVIKKQKGIEAEHDLPKLFKRLKVLQKRVIMLMCASGLERYEHFESTYPNIVQRVTQKMIASYLGITPEALSNVRSKRISKK